MLLWGCRGVPGRRQGSVCIAGLQRGAVFIPARLQSSLLQDCRGGPVWVLHTPEARGCYLRTGTVPSREGNAGSVPGLQQRQPRRRHRPGSPASPRGTPDHAWPQVPGEEKVPNGSSPAGFSLQTSNVIFLLKIFTVVKLQNKPISKGKQVGQRRGAAKGAHKHAPKAVRRNEAFLQLRDTSPGARFHPTRSPSNKPL